MSDALPTLPLTIETIFPYVLGVIAADVSAGDYVGAALVPAVSQLDPQYSARYEAALQSPGVVFVLWSAGGVPASGNDTPLLDLENGLLLSVVENTAPGKNTTGLSALQWVRRLLQILHQSGRPQRGARAVIRHPEHDPAYEIGPVGHGRACYFINLVVRSTEPTQGALPGAAAVRPA